MNIDEPVLSPKRLYFAVRWYFWWRKERDAGEIALSLRQVFLNYRRSYAAHRKGRY